MNWFIETHWASRDSPPDPWPGAWHLSLIFLCPFLLKSSDLYWLAQLTWNVSRIIWSDGEGFLCAWQMSRIYGKRGYTLNFHNKTQPFIIKYVQLQWQSSPDPIAVYKQCIFTYANCFVFSGLLLTRHRAFVLRTCTLSDYVIKLACFKSRFYVHDTLLSTVVLSADAHYFLYSRISITLGQLFT